MAGRGEEKEEDEEEEDEEEEEEEGEKEEEEKAAATLLQHSSHPHPLFLGYFDGCSYFLICDLCRCSIDDNNGYSCTTCDFNAHKGCIQDRYYKDGTRIPRVYHRHELKSFSAEDGETILCGNCESSISWSDYFGCETCAVFYHRDCVKFPDTLQYPLHPDHDALVLSIRPRDDRLRCQSCSLVANDLCYCCTSCDFTLHARCGHHTLLYFQEGRAMEIVLSWHKHPPLLCHKERIHWDLCSCCGNTFDGPAYRCTAKDCNLILHEGCAKQSSEINHPHHPGHPLVLLVKFEEPRPICDACFGETFPLRFSCELCRFYLHVSCASRFPNRKHYFHEHDLVHFDKISSVECNRCHTSDDSSIFRCVPCDFNLHEKCMLLPGVVKHKTHRHPLTLRDFFMEDDTGEYYCDLCEQRRDGRLGVYMCLVCKMERPWTFHIECILPELRKVNMKKVCKSILKKSAEEVSKKEEQLWALEKRVEETKRELEQMKKKHAKLSLLKAQGEEE